MEHSAKPHPLRKWRIFYLSNRWWLEYPDGIGSFPSRKKAEERAILLWVNIYKARSLRP